MTEITEIDMNKYLVLKWRDIETELCEGEKEQLKAIIKTIQQERQEHGKKDNRYLVLNMDDEIDTFDMFYAFANTYPDYIIDDAPKILRHKIKVSGIAVALVNSILKAKERK